MNQIKKLALDFKYQLILVKLAKVQRDFDHFRNIFMDTRKLYFTILN